MGVDMKVKAIYDSEIGNITRSEKNWKDVLKVAGQLYRYEFDNIVMVTAQRPPEKSTLMAEDENGQEYTDNGERAIFFARGVLETVKIIIEFASCPFGRMNTL